MKISEYNQWNSMRNKILRIFRTVLNILTFLIVSAPMTHCQQYLQYFDIRMSFQISRLSILSAISPVGGTCQRSDQTPEVKVLNSSHVFISWQAPFQGCERERIQSAHVVIVPWQRYTRQRSWFQCSSGDKISTKKIETEPLFDALIIKAQQFIWSKWQTIKSTL